MHFSILNKRLEEKGYNSKMSVSSNLDVDYKEDFFGKLTSLTVSGQLDVEPFAMAFRNVLNNDYRNKCQD